jgi:demethylmenaquinone methyltransferase/2-methoxy-6-polyprenyl-1,4-benzoquinol methylase
VAGDALHLPFADDSFDAVTISFGLRNVEDPTAALAEFARVTRPGGRLVVCEFSRPRPAPIRWGYRWYLHNVLPKLAGRVSSNPEAYTYLQETIDAWPDQPSLARLITRAGWTDVRWRNMTFGVVALHRAVLGGS